MGRKSEPSRLGGCFSMAATCALASLMFIVNGFFIREIYSDISAQGPDWLQHPKVAQILLFVAPVLLLVVQWWLFDLIRDRVGRLVRRPLP